MGNIDDFLQEAALDELKDKLELAKYASISEFAKAIGEQPQLVHYYVRRGQIEKKPCDCCGRMVIDVAQATEVFANRKKDK